LLAIAAVVDVALNARDHPISARKLAELHDLPPRHLEPVLQALVHQGIFSGMRGPRGGYQLSRDRKRITIADILRAADAADDNAAASAPMSRILEHVVLPAISDAEKAFAAALARLTVDELMRRAEALSECR
jgi:Rrf2 family protein